MVSLFFIYVHFYLVPKYLAVVTIATANTASNNNNNVMTKLKIA